MPKCKCLPKLYYCFVWWEKWQVIHWFPLYFNEMHFNEKWREVIFTTWGLFNFSCYVPLV